jgi:hypothetical protein
MRMKGNHAIFFALWAIAALVALVALAGLAIPGLYAGTACGASREAFLGQDAVSLLVLLLFVPAILPARRSSLGGEIMVLGCLAYYGYTYGYYAFGLADTPLYLGYLAIFGLSVFAFVFLASRCAPTRRFAETPARMPRIAVAAFLAFAAAFTGLAVELPPLLASAFAWKPAGMKTSKAFIIMDLALLFPGMAIAAYLALRRRSEGLFFSGVLLVKTATLMPAILAADAINLAEGGRLLDPSFDIAALVFLAASVVLALLYFRSLPKAPSASNGPGEERRMPEAPSS